MDEKLDHDPLFSTKRIYQAPKSSAPLIVVGLPRSGSSFLSHILSQVPDWYVFDDLYLHRKARELGVSSPLTPRDLEKLMFFLGWQIRARIRFGLYAIPDVSEEEVPALNSALEAAFAEQPGSWAELQEEWMMRLAHRAECGRWGYKMPTAFRYIPELLGYYPDALFMFIMRNPHKVLASYKFMPATSQDGDPRRYHPVAYAFYWRMAARSYQKHRELLGERITLVQFEDLVSAPQQTAEHIAGFLDAQPPQEVHVPPKPNSSFSSEPKPKSLTGLETWILTKIAHREMAALGYETQQVPVKLGDFIDFILVSVRVSVFHMSNILGKLKRKLTRS